MGRDFRFPVSLGVTVPLNHSLHEKSKIVSSRPPESATNRHNLKTAIRQAKQKGYDPEVHNIFVDLDASERFASWRHDLCPCITRTRAASAGFYITSRKRRLSTAEMLKLQGIRPENMRKYWGMAPRRPQRRRGQRHVGLRLGTPAATDCLCHWLHSRAHAGRVVPPRLHCGGRPFRQAEAHRCLKGVGCLSCPKLGRFSCHSPGASRLAMTQCNVWSFQVCLAVRNKRSPQGLML